MRLKKCFCLFFFLLSCAVTLTAQFETASIVGTVTDSSGALISNARVVATDIATGIQTSRVTDKSGQYVLPALRDGAYRLEVSAKGFSDALIEGVNLRVGTNQSVNVQLRIGATETITVDAGQMELEKETSHRQQVVDEQAIKEFPLMNMDYTDLLTMASGVTLDSSGQDLGTSSVIREGSYNINGQRPTFNNYLLDGMDNNAHGTSNQGFSNQIINPPQFSISQFSIVTTLPPAEYGRSSGGTINVAFKQGTNQFHGRVYDSLRNTLANANGFFKATSNSGATSRTTLNRNQFGFNLGGPLLRGRLFFFTDYEGLRQVRQVVNQSNIFKLSDHQLIASPNATANTTTVLNPFTGATYAADRPLPRSVLSPIALAILDTFPLPNNNGAGAASISSNWSALQRFTNSYDKEDARLDMQWTPRMSTFARLSQSKEHDLDGPILPAPLSGGNGYLRTINQQIALGLTRQIRTSQLLEARLGASYTKGGKMPVVTGDTRTFGIQGLPTDPRVWGGLTTIGLSGYSGIGRQSTNPQWQYPFFLNPKITYSFLHGKHNSKIGYEFSYLRQIVQDVNPIYGDMEFQSSFTGYAISDFLFGVPNQINLTNFYTAHIRQGGHAAFAQDDWKVSPNLTVNIGVRYEYSSHFYDKDGRLTNFDPASTPYNGQMLRARTSGSAYERQLVDPTLTDFMPRVGFAYSPLRQLVVHGGYGIGYVHSTRSGEADNLAINGPQVNAAVYNQVPKYFKTANVKTSANFYTLDNGFPQGMAAQSNYNLQTSTIKWIPRNYTDPYVQSWYLSIQTALPKKLLLDLAYIGNRGVKLQEIGNYNQRIPELGNDPITGYFVKPFNNLGDVLENFNGGYNKYHGLQVRVQQNMYHGIWLLNAFTWSRDFGNVGDSLTSSRGFSGSPQDIHNLKRDYGPTQYDVPILNNTALMYSLPFGRGKLLFRHAGPVTNRIVGGWRIITYNQFHSGSTLTPNFTPSGFQELSNSGGVQYRPFMNSTTPDVTFRKQAAQRLHIPGHPEAAFCDTVYASLYGCTVMFATTNPNPTAISGAGSSADPRGDVPNGFLRADSFDQFDAGLNKSINLPWRDLHVDIRGQFYNVVNKTNFTPPGMTCCSTSFGRITSTYGPGRIGQIQAVIIF